MGNEIMRSQETLLKMPIQNISKHEYAFENKYTRDQKFKGGFYFREKFRRFYKPW